MLIVYFKRTGKISTIATGDNQSMQTMFGEYYEDYKKIMDEISMPDDQNIIRNPQHFRVNPDTKEIEILPEYAVSQYKVAEIDSDEAQ